MSLSIFYFDKPKNTGNELKKRNTKTDFWKNDAKDKKPEIERKLKGK